MSHNVLNSRQGYLLNLGGRTTTERISSRPARLQRLLCIQELPGVQTCRRRACLETGWPVQQQHQQQQSRTARSRCLVYASSDASASSGPMRKLVMMRHADSNDSGGGRDIDRSITDTGRQSARQVAEQLAARGWLPDLILCSDSTRTQQTLFAMQAAVGALKNVRTLFRGQLYISSALDGETRKNLEELIQEETEDSNVLCIMCLGHNKGWEEAASSFAARNIRLQPANAALLQVCGATWYDALHGQTAFDLVDTLRPSPAAAPGSGIPSLA